MRTGSLTAEEQAALAAWPRSFVTAPELYEILGRTVGYSTIRGWAADGRLKALRVGATWMIPIASLDGWEFPLAGFRQLNREDVKRLQAMRVDGATLEEALGAFPDCPRSTMERYWAGKTWGLFQSEGGRGQDNGEGVESALAEVQDVADRSDGQEFMTEGGARPAHA